MKLLIVDDEKDLLYQAKIFLQKIDEDIKIHTVTSADKALDIIGKKNFDVIVSDYQMPDIDGLELLKELREERKNDIPFIMFTGKGREDVAMKALNMGADRYIQKGGDPKSQYGVLASAIKQEVTHYKTEIERKHYTQQLQFLNRILIKVSRMKDPDEICEYVADKVYSLDEDDYVTVALYDREKEAIRIRSVAGFDDYPQLVEGLMQSDEELTFDPDKKDEWSDIYSSGNLERMPQGLYSLVKGVLSKEEAENIEDLLGVEEVYSVGFSLEEKPYGGITIMKASEGDVKFSSAIETIGSHLSVILQRRQYEEQLRRSRKKIKRNEKRYKNLFDSIRDAILVTDTGRNIIECNQAFNDIFGYDLEEIKGKKTEYLYHDVEQFERMGDEIREHMGEENFYYNIDYQKKSGDVFPGETKVFYLKDDEGEITGFIGVIRDITERKKKEKELREERNFIEQIAETSPVCITKVDKNGHITYANEKAEDILGLSKSEIKGRTYDDVKWEITDYDGEEFPNEELPFNQVKEKGEAVYDVRHAIEWPDGERKLLSINAAPLFDEAGNFDGMVASIDDVTEKVEKEKELDEVKERYDALFERSMDAVYIHDLEGNILDVNQATFELLGYKRGDIEDLKFTDLLPEDQLEKAFETLSEVMKTGTQDELTVFEVKTKHGEKKLIETKSSLIYKDGEPYAVLGIARDITERKRALETLKQKNKENEAMLDSMMNAFVLFESVFDDDGNFVSYRFVYINEAYEEMTGVKLEKVKGKTVHEVWPETEQEWVERYGEVAVTGESQTFDLHHSPTDKTYHCNVYRPYDTKEKFCVIFEDISEQEEKEQKLRKERKKFQEIFNNVNDAIYLHELTEEGMPGRFIEVNETAVEMLGYSREEFLEMSPEKIDAAEKSDEVPEVMNELVDKGEIKFELVHQAKDGTKIPVEIHSHLFEFEEKKRVLSVVRDITERKEAERKLKSSQRKFKSSFETSPDPTFLLDNEGVFKDVNEVALEKLGYDKEEIVGKTLQEQPFLGEEAVKKTVKNFLKRKEGKDVPPYEVEMFSKGGDILYAEVNASTFEGDGFEGEIVIGRDITEKKKAKEEMEEKERKLTELYKITPKIELAEDLKELYELIIDTARNILDFNVCSVEIEEDGELVVKASTEEELVEEEYSMPIENGIAGKSYKNNESYLSGDIHKEDEAKPTDSDFRSAISIPMGDIGVFQALSYEEDYYDEKDLEMAELFVSYVTEAINRIDAVKALQESEERYRALVETAFAGIGITDFKDNFTYVNDRLADMLGYEKDELVGMNVEEIAPDEEREKYLEETEKRKEGETSVYESRLVKKNGEVIDVMIYASPFKDASGEFVGTMGIVTDITERKEMQRRLRESEEKFRTITESSADAIFITDQEGNYEYVNETASELLVYSKEELLDKSISDLSRKEDVEDNIQGFKRLLEKGEIFTEMKLVKKDGTVILVDLNAVLLPNGMVYGSCRDITKRKEAQEREELLHTLLRHDIKNKAQIVQGYLQLLEEQEELSEETRDYVEKALNGNKESINLIQKVRLLLSAQREETKPVNIASTIHEAVDATESLVEDRGMEISLNCPSIECEVKGGTLLKQVFSNLIENSVYHSEGSQIKISGEIKGDEVVCIIEDDGKGIPDDKKDTILEKGFTTDVERGTGLGMFLVKMLLESYDGSIEVKDSELGGVRFDIHLKRV